MFAGTVVVMGVSGTGKTEVASRCAPCTAVIK